MGLSGPGWSCQGTASQREEVRVLKPDMRARRRTEAGSVAFVALGFVSFRRVSSHGRIKKTGLGENFIGYEIPTRCSPEV